MTLKEIEKRLGKRVAKFGVSVAKRHGLIKLNSTLKAMVIENPSITIGDLLVKHSENPMRPETIGLVREAIMKIDGNLIVSERAMFDQLTADLANSNARYEDRVKSKRKAAKLSDKVAISAAKIGQLPVPTLGDIFRAKLNDKTSDRSMSDAA